jgi:hypothetical protein
MRDQEILDLMEAYTSIYTNISESHFKVGDKVVCKDSGMKGEVVKLDKPDGEEDEKYYTVEREDGKKMKYAPNELKSAGNGGASKEKEEKFHTKLDKLVHKTFGSSPEEKKMKEEVDIFDVILEHLVTEGYADTNDAALVIMVNMSEEWRQSIVEAEGDVNPSVNGRPMMVGGKPLSLNQKQFKWTQNMSKLKKDDPKKYKEVQSLMTPSGWKQPPAGMKVPSWL